MEDEVLVIEVWVRFPVDALAGAEEFCGAFGVAAADLVVAVLGAVLGSVEAEALVGVATLVPQLVEGGVDGRGVPCFGGAVAEDEGALVPDHCSGCVEEGVWLVTPHVIDNEQDVGDTSVDAKAGLPGSLNWMEVLRYAIDGHHALELGPGALAGRVASTAVLVDVRPLAVDLGSVADYA